MEDTSTYSDNKMVVAVCLHCGVQWEALTKPNLNVKIFPQIFITLPLR